MSERDLIRQLVAEEIARPEVQATLAEATSRNLLGRITKSLRHPLVITLAGFLLTALVGTQIENQLADSRQRAEAREIRVERAYEVEEDARAEVQDFVALVYRRAVEADLLRSAIERKSTPELLARKAAYDQAYRDWNQGQPDHLHALRRVWAGSDRALISKRSPYEDAVVAYIDRDFGAADACLTRYFDAVVDEVIADQTYANTPGDYCADDDWAETVNVTTGRARNCAVAILAISLEELRQRTDADVDAILSDREPSHASSFSPDSLQAALKTACTSDPRSDPATIELESGK